MREDQIDNTIAYIDKLEEALRLIIAAAGNDNRYAYFATIAREALCAHD